MPTMPTSPSFQSINVQRNKSTPFTRSPFTGDIHVYEWVGSDKWQFDATLPAISDNTVKGNWIAFLLDMEGMSETFTLDLNSAPGSTHDYAQGLSNTPTTTYPTSWRLREPIVGWSINEAGHLVNIVIKAVES